MEGEEEIKRDKRKKGGALFAMVPSLCHHFPWDPGSCHLPGPKEDYEDLAFLPSSEPEG